MACTPLAQYGTSISRPASSLLTLPKTLANVFWNTLLLLVSLVCGALATLGWAILLYLLLTRSLTPRQATRSESLQLDFTEGAIVGVASFLPSSGKTGQQTSANRYGGACETVMRGRLHHSQKHLPPDHLALLAGRRFVPAGEKLDVWIEILVPGSNFEGGMVQAKAELLSPEGAIAATTSLAVRLHGRPRTLR